MTKTEKTTGRKPNAALMKPVQPDDALAVIVGSTPLPRGELTKKLWDYIKKNKLQDETKRTLINADDALKVVFGGKSQVSMFEMTKLVSGHINELASLNSPGKVSHVLFSGSSIAASSFAFRCIRTASSEQAGFLAQTVHRYYQFTALLSQIEKRRERGARTIFDKS